MPSRDLDVTHPKGPPSYWVIAGVVMLLLAALAAAIVSIPPHDLWWQLRAGQILATEGRIPRVDRFSFTARGEPWLVQEWLSCLLFYQLQLLFQWSSLVVLRFVLAAIAAVGIFRAGVRRGAHPLLSAAAAALVLWSIRPWLAIRPQLFTYAFIAVTLALIEGCRGSQRRWARLFMLFPVTALWANFHSGALLAPILVGVEAAGSLLDGLRPDGGSADRTWAGRCAIVALAVAAATLLNPYGAALWSYPGKVLANPIVADFITEWQSPDFHLGGLGPIVGLFWALLVVLIVGGPRRPNRDFLILALLFWVGMLHKRNLPIAALVAGPVLAARATEWLTGRFTVRWAWVGAGASAAALLPIAAGLAKAPTREIFASQAGMYDFPVAAVRYLAGHPPPGPLWNEYRWGGFLIWCVPAVPVFIDGRAELYYRTGVFDDYVTVARLHAGWRQSLDRHGIRAVLAEPNLPVVQALQLDPRWRIAYRDSQAVLLER